MTLELQHGLYLLVNLVVSGFVLALAIHIWLNRKLIALPMASMALLTFWFWVLTEAAEYTVPGIEYKLFFNQLQYVATSLIPVFWIAFSYYYKHEKSLFERKRYLLIFLVSALLITLVYTNPLTQWLWDPVTLDATGYALKKSYNPLFYGMMGLTYGMMAIGYIQIMTMHSWKKIFRTKQSIAIALAVSLPLSLNVIEITIGFFNIFFEIAPLTFALSCGAIIFYIRKRYTNYTLLTQETIMESLNSPLLLINEKTQVVYANKAACSLFHRNIKGMIDTEISDLIPDFSNSYNDPEKNIPFFLQNRKFGIQISPLETNGSIKMILLEDVTTLKKSEEKLRYLANQLEERVLERTRRLNVINEDLITEIKERKKSENKLNLALKEKDTLIYEIHHRVKNNLQLISSLLKLQMNATEDVESRAIFQDAVARIKVIAIIHEKLYQDNNLETVNIQKYIHLLLDYIISMHNSENSQVGIDFNIEELNISLSTGIHIGLIINEAVINSLKYAFPDKGNHIDNPQIKVLLVEQEGSMKLVIRDNGQGFSKEVLEMEKPTTLGFKIMKTLSRQLRGNLSIYNDDGAVFQLIFKDEEE